MNDSISLLVPLGHFQQQVVSKTNHDSGKSDGIDEAKKQLFKPYFTSTEQCDRNLFLNSKKWMLVYLKWGLSSSRYARIFPSRRRLEAASLRGQGDGRELRKYIIATFRSRFVIIYITSAYEYLKLYRLIVELKRTSSSIMISEKPEAPFRTD